MSTVHNFVTATVPVRRLHTLIMGMNSIFTEAVKDLAEINFFLWTA